MDDSRNLPEWIDLPQLQIVEVEREQPAVKLPIPVDPEAINLVWTPAKKVSQPN